MRHKLVITGKSPEVREARVFLPGTVSDRVMRRFLEQDEHKPGDMERMAREIFDHYADNDPTSTIRWRSANDRAVTYNFVVECVNNLEPLLFEHVLPFDYAPELRFRTSIYIPYLDGTPVRVELVGGIDIAVRKPTDQWHLHDLKATRDPSYANKVLGQMIFYDIAFKAFTGHQPVYSGLIMPLCKEKMPPVKVTDAERRDMMSRIITMAHGIWRREWSLAPTKEPCQRCDVKAACPRYAVPLDIEKGKISFEAVAAQRQQAEEALGPEPSELDILLGEVRSPNEPFFGQDLPSVSFDRKV
jgi:hypothetical protein